MKGLAIVALLIFTFTFIGCKKSKEDKCTEMINHVMKITFDFDKMNEMMRSPEIDNRIKENIRRKIKMSKEKGIKQCVQEFTESYYQCIIRTKKADEVKKCVR